MGEPDIADALAERALTRSANGLAISGLAFGVIAGAFLLLAGGQLGPQSLPQLVLLGYANLLGLLAALSCWRRLPPVRAGADGPQQAQAAVTTLGWFVRALVFGELALAAALLVALRPFDVVVISVALSLAVAAQLMAVLLTVSGWLRRAARRLPTADHDW